MHSFLLNLVLASCVLGTGAHAQIPVQANENHEQLLASTDSRLEANKRLVYDFYREVFEGGHMEFVEKYLSESYIQHNPSVPSGRAAFVEFFSKIAKPRIEVRMKAPVVAMVAEGDLVVVSFVREYNEPSNATRKYTSTCFDMYPIEGGKIAEHGDGAQKR